MLEAKPRGVSGVNATVTANGVPLATIDGKLRGFRGTISLGGQDYKARKARMSGLVLTLGDTTIAQASHKALSRSWTITFGDRVLMLKSASIFRRAYEVLENGSVVGDVTPKSFVSRGLTATLPDDVPEPVQVFLILIVLSVWRRRQTAAASS